MGVSGPEKQGSLKTFQHWLEVVAGISDASTVVVPLFVLHDLRQLPGHLIGERSREGKLESAQDRLDLESTASLEEIYDRLVEELIVMYERLEKEVATDRQTEPGQSSLPEVQ